MMIACARAWGRRRRRRRAACCMRAGAGAAVSVAVAGLGDGAARGSFHAGVGATDDSWSVIIRGQPRPWLAVLVAVPVAVGAGVSRLVCDGGRTGAWVQAAMAGLLLYCRQEEVN